MASNPYVNKVEANGTVLIDLTGDDATASDVAQGKWFHLASGERVQGTSEGGGEPFSLTNYIESSGTQWIDTGYFVTDTSKFELVANVSSTNASYASMFGTRVNSGTSASALGAFFWAKHGGSKRFTADWGVGQTNLVELPPSNFMYDVKNEYTLYKNIAGVYTKSLGQFKHYINPAKTPTNQYPIYLFNLDEAGHEYGADTRCTMKLYRFRIFEGESLVMELLPYEDNGDVCLKDTVTGNLFKNAGTGSFVFGRDE